MAGLNHLIQKLETEEEDVLSLKLVKIQLALELIQEKNLKVSHSSNFLKVVSCVYEGLALLGSN